MTGPSNDGHLKRSKRNRTSPAQKAQRLRTPSNGTGFPNHENARGALRSGIAGGMGAEPWARLAEKRENRAKEAQRRSTSEAKGPPST